MEEELRARSIRIPVGDECVEFYPDELPADVCELEEVLQDSFAPLEAWHSSALEYHRQGRLTEFEQLLEEISEADATVLSRYKEQGNYEAGMLRIWHALAASALLKMDAPNSSPEESRRLRVKFNQCLDRAAGLDEVHPYSSLLNGFFELKARDPKKAGILFKNVRESPLREVRERFGFVAILGQAAVSLALRQTKVALEYFAKAIELNPACSATVRIALAVCCFDLQQFERSRLAVKRALSLEPSNVDGLLLLALLERVDAHKYKTRKAEFYRNAYEYCMLAAHLDKNNAMALNHIAQHLFFSWKLVSEQAVPLSPSEIQFPIAGDCFLANGDLIRVNEQFNSAVQEVRRSGDVITLVLQQPLPVSDSGHLRVEAKEINYIKSIVHKALKASKVDAVNAESLYILGRVYHLLGVSEGALHYYLESLKRWEDFPLAAMGVAQLLLAKQDYEGALKYFEQVREKYPNDRDANAYIILIRSITKSETVDFERLKEMVSGFAFEASIWQLQGYFRQQDPKEQVEALKCYEMAYSVLRKNNIAPPANFLCNLAVLNYLNGNAESALSFSRQAIQAAMLPAISEPAAMNKVFDSEENSFLNFEDPSLYRISSDGNDVVTLINCNGAFCSSLLPGDVLIAEGVYLKILAADGAVLKIRTTIPLLAGEYDATKISGGSMLRDETLVLCFNYARFLELTGSFAAAEEIYEAIIKFHPSFVECESLETYMSHVNALGYIRMGCVRRDCGRYSDALSWFEKALPIASDELEVGLFIGDICLRMKKHQEGRELYEKGISEGAEIPRQMLLLGNFYFSYLYSSQNQPSAKFDECLKQSYKFYNKVLEKDKSKTNVFAASGLGMVLAEMGHLSAAREIFLKLREAVPSSTNVSVNLAHVCLHLGRWGEAIHLYQTMLRLVPPDYRVEVLVSLALAFFKNRQLDEAILSLQKALQYNPSAPHLLFNLAYARQELAMGILHRQSKTVREIKLAIEELKIANELLSSLLHDSGSERSKGLLRNGVMLLLKNFCEKNIVDAQSVLDKVFAEEESLRLTRETQEREHEIRLEQLRRQHQAEEEEAAKVKQEMQEKAQEQLRKLQQLQETWAINTTASQNEKPKRQKKPKKEVREEDEEESASDSDIENKYTKRRKINTASTDSGEGAGLEESADERNVEKKKKLLKLSTPSDIFDSDNDEDGSPQARNFPVKSFSGGLKRKATRSDDDEDIDFDVSTEKVEEAVLAKRRTLVDEEEDEMFAE